jgi:hypothetical protein
MGSLTFAHTYEIARQGRASNFGRGQKGSMRLLMKISPLGAVAILTSTLIVSGCSRKSGDMSSSQAYDQTNQFTGQSGPSAAPVTQAAGQPDMAALDRAARLWMFQNRRRPTSWEDFAAHASVQIPPPPPGKKYVLSKDMRVTLVDR